MNSVGVQVVQDLLTADFPWLGWPVIKNILGLGLGWLDGYLSKAEQSGATFFVIDTQISGEESEIKKALKALLAAKKSGDPNAIKNALAQYQKAQSALANYDGAAPPK